MKKHKPLRPDNDWNIKDLETVWEIVQEINENKYQIDHYPARFELISFEGMLSAYSTVALPGMFDHWSFGKQYVQEESKYRQTHNLAFEVVINSNPSVCYLMDSNTFTTQALVIAHAAIGHSGFFKNNHMFKTHTRADMILPFLKRSSARIKELEEEHGEDFVESVIDCCNSLKYHSYDKHPVKTLSDRERKEKRKEELDGRESRKDKVLDFTLSKRYGYLNGLQNEESWGDERGTNILKFIRDNSINIQPETQEIISIMLEINQYLYPQLHTQLMNEGFASFTHYNIMHDMCDMGYLTEGQFWEFTQLHCSVLNQRGIGEGNTTINPYKLGFDMYKDIKKICLDPTEEDRKWFPEFAGNPDWIGEVKKAAYGYKDESFISQYLSPRLIREYKMLHMQYDYDLGSITMKDTHDDIGYNRIISRLSNQYDFFSKLPELEAYTLTAAREELNLTILLSNSHDLNIDEMSTVKEDLQYLWGGQVDIHIRYKEGEGNDYDLD